MKVTQSQGIGIWVGGAVFTNPADQTVLATSGALALTSADTGTAFLCAIHGTSSAAWVYDAIQYKADGETVVHKQRRRLSAGVEDFVFPSKIVLKDNEVFSVVLQGAVTGEVQMSLFYVPVAA